MTKTNPDPRLSCASLMEQIARSEGLAPNAGRILGYLLMAEGPVPFSELHRELKMSKGSVSENTTHLEEIGLLEKLQPEGSRQVFFQYRCDAADALVERAVQRARDHLVLVSDFARATPLSPAQGVRIDAMSSFIEARISMAETFSPAPVAKRQTD